METSSQAGGLAGEDTNTGYSISAGWILTSALLGLTFQNFPQRYTNSQGGHSTQEVQPLALTPLERPRQVQAELIHSPTHTDGAGQVRQ